MRLKVFLCLFLVNFVQIQAQVLLKDIGVIGLASHDIFTWDHKAEVNNEDGRLNLSTIFDYDNGSRLSKGGNPKNSENAPVYTITMNLVDFYKQQLKITHNKANARHDTIKLFRQMVKESYERMSGSSFPTKCKNKKVTNVEQAVLRAMHDILPGRVKLYRGIIFPFKELKLTNAFTAKIRLNEKELLQPLKPFNGDYDQEYKNIKIPFAGITLNLKEIDGKFIEKFSPYKQAEMLKELAKVGRGELSIQKVSFIHHLKELFSKAICENDK